jgi:hypothetical protein
MCAWYLPRLGQAKPMPGYLFQIASTATAGSHAAGPRLRPAVRSRSPIAEYDQRLGMAAREATVGSGTRIESGPNLMVDGSLSDAAGDYGTTGLQGPPLVPAQQWSSGTELASSLSTVARPGTSVAPNRGVAESAGHGRHSRPASGPAGVENSSRVSGQPTKPAWVSTSGTEWNAVLRGRSAVRPDPDEGPSPDSEQRSEAPVAERLPATASGASAGAVTRGAHALGDREMAVASEGVAVVGGRSVAGERGGQPARERVRTPSAAEQMAPVAPIRGRESPGIADATDEGRSVTGPRVRIDRLEIEIVPPSPPPVPVRRPGVGEGVGNRSVSRIGPLSDPMAAGRSLALRYR